jgi:hypothetical protein
MHAVLDSEHRSDFISIQIREAFKEGSSQPFLLSFNTLDGWRKLKMVSCKYTP